MKKLAVLGVVALLLVTGLGVMAPQPVSAQGGKPRTVTLSWKEGYTMYWPDGTLVGGPWYYEVTDVDFQKFPESETYRTTDMEDFMAGGYAPGTDPRGFIMVTRTGKLHGRVTYISGRSGLPIYQVFNGNVEVIDDTTMDGEYHDRVYARGTEAEVLEFYPGAVRIGRSNLWFIAYGDYEVNPL